MLLIILGIVIIVIAMVRIFKAEVFSTAQLFGFTVLYGFLTMFGAAGIALGASLPLHGYYEPVITQEYELVEIIENSDVYVIEDSDKRLFFKYIASSNETEMYDLDKEENLEVLISDEYEKPTLVKFHRKAKKGILSLALGISRTDYKIYAAEENIKRFE